MKYVLAVGSSKIDDVIVTFIGQNTRKRTENGSRPIRRRYVNNLSAQQVTEKARDKLGVLHGRINDQWQLVFC